MNTETIIEKFQEQEIAFDLFRGDLMVNATEMAKPFGKRVRNFLANEQTKSFINALISSPEFLEKNGFNQLEFQLIKKSEILNRVVITKPGRYHNGTYMCEELAIQFAMWLSPEFNVWVIQTIQKIIFGNNPELVREAVMNMPRIQKELDRLRRKKNRLKAIILGPDRRKDMAALINKRYSINHQIQNLTYLPTIKSLKLDADSLGDRMIKLIEERDTLDEAIRAKNQEFEKLLVVDEYMDLVKAIADLEREQRHYAKMIRYSEIKFSNN